MTRQEEDGPLKSPKRGLGTYFIAVSRPQILTPQSAMRQETIYPELGPRDKGGINRDLEVKFKHDIVPDCGPNTLLDSNIYQPINNLFI
jgi:hypothetical protein